MTAHRRNKNLLFRAAAIATEATHARRSAVEVHHEARDSRAEAHAVVAEEVVHVAVVEAADSHYHQ